LNVALRSYGARYKGLVGDNEHFVGQAMVVTLYLKPVTTIFRLKSHFILKVPLKLR